jgi:hypothetical protein
LNHLNASHRLAFILYYVVPPAEHYIEQGKVAQELKFI